MTTDWENQFKTVFKHPIGNKEEKEGYVQKE